MFGMELMDCPSLAVPREVMHHVVRVESSFNPYAIGVVGGRLARQPRNLPEAVATARMLERRGYNFSLGLAQVNRYNLAKQGLRSYEQAFQACPNLQAGSRILAECHGRSGGSWGRAFSCYYSGNFVTGYRHGYVQKVFASMRESTQPVPDEALAIDVIGTPSRSVGAPRPKAAAKARRDMRAGVSRDARVAARIAPAATAGSSVPAEPNVPTPDAPAPTDATVAVIDPGGAPPRLLNAATGATSAPAPATPQLAPPVPAVDSAFVF